MKPSRSPRFQSAADRCSIAAISRGGLPRVGGAEQAVAIMDKTTYDARRTIFLSLTWPRERLVETLPRMWYRVVLAAAFLLGRLFLRGFSLLRLRTRFLGGFLFLAGFRLGRARLFHWHGRGRRRRWRRREHRLHEPRSRPTALRYIHLLKHRKIGRAHV